VLLVDRDEYLREFTGEMIKAALDVTETETEVHLTR
jgi:hypothetical protein